MGELVEKCGEDTVASHVLGQTHCVSIKSQLVKQIGWSGREKC